MSSKAALPFIKAQFFDDNGAPLALGKLYTYAAGGTVPLATYDGPAGAANVNPVVLDSAGRANIFLSSASYRFVLKDAAGTTIFDLDGILGGDLDHLAPWVAYTPFVTAGVGALTLVSATGKYLRFGHTVHFEIAITITNHGTAAAYISASLPVACITETVCTGRYITGVLLGSIPAGSAVDIFKYDGTYRGSDGDVLRVSGTYEI